MLKTVRSIAMLAVAVALLAVPATALAAPGGQGKAKSCAKAPKVGFQVSGTLVSVTPDNPATPGVTDPAVTLTVTNANSHALKSGDVVKGANYTVPTTDSFELKLNGYEGTDVPAVGDRVKVSGRIARTKKRCAPNATTADRYLVPDVRRVTIWNGEDVVV